MKRNLSGHTRAPARLCGHVLSCYPTIEVLVARRINKSRVNVRQRYMYLHEYSTTQNGCQLHSIVHLHALQTTVHGHGHVSRTSSSRLTATWGTYPAQQETDPGTLASTDTHSTTKLLCTSMHHQLDLVVEESCLFKTHGSRSLCPRQNHRALDSRQPKRTHRSS